MVITKDSFFPQDRKVC